MEDKNLNTTLIEVRNQKSAPFMICFRIFIRTFAGKKTE